MPSTHDQHMAQQTGHGPWLWGKPDPPTISGTMPGAPHGGPRTMTRRCTCVSELPQRVRAVLDEHIFSASQLEVLLLLQAHPGRRWTLAEVGEEMRLPLSSIGPWLDAFVSRQLLVRESGHYAWEPHDPQLVADLAEVADAYARRRTTVSRYLYARGQDPLTRFADAFRFRRASGPTEEER